MQVTIRLCKGDAEPVTVRVRTTDQNEAIARAVRRAFGKRMTFYPEHGAPGYGLVVGPVRGEPYTKSVECRVRVEVRP